MISQEAINYNQLVLITLNPVSATIYEMIKQHRLLLTMIKHQSSSSIHRYQLLIAIDVNYYCGQSTNNRWFRICLTNSSTNETPIIHHSSSFIINPYCPVSSIINDH